jgi:hypothetical protein
MPIIYERSHMLIKPCLRSYPISPNKTMILKDVVLEK